MTRFTRRSLQIPDNTPIREVQFPTRIKNALFAAGLKTVGEVREMSDAALLSLPDFALHPAQE
jgi:DNA-directed RNA polymerase alpha subunit